MVITNITNVINILDFVATFSSILSAVMLIDAELGNYGRGPKKVPYVIAGKLMVIAMIAYVLKVICAGFLGWDMFFGFLISTLFFSIFSNHKGYSVQKFIPTIYFVIKKIIRVTIEMLKK